MARKRNDVHAIRDAIQLYFERRDANPLAVAYHWSLLPDVILLPFFDTCVAFLHEVANREGIHDPMMKANQEYARRMLDK